MLDQCGVQVLYLVFLSYLADPSVYICQAVTGVLLGLLGNCGNWCRTSQCISGTDKMSSRGGWMMVLVTKCCKYSLVIGRGIITSSSLGLPICGFVGGKGCAFGLQSVTTAAEVGSGCKS